MPELSEAYAICLLPPNFVGSGIIVLVGMGVSVNVGLSEGVICMVGEAVNEKVGLGDPIIFGVKGS